MNDQRLPLCTQCGSDNVLPFEDDSPVEGDTTLFIITLAVVLVLTAYFLFVVSSYLYTPIVVFISIIIITRMINKHQSTHKKKYISPVSRDYVCLDCNAFFKWKQ